MSVIYFVGILLCAYFGTVMGFNLWTRKQKEQDFEIKCMPAVAAFLCGAILLELTANALIFGTPSVSVYTWIACLLIGILYLTARFDSVKQKGIWMPLVCVAGTYVLHKVIPDLPMPFPQSLLISGAWLITMITVLFFDKLPLLSFLTFSVWSLSFAIGTAVGNFIPIQLTSIAWMTLIPVWGLMVGMVKRKEGSLGPYATTLISFIMGGIVATTVAYGAYGSSLSLMAYYLFEAFFFALAWFGFHPMGMQKGEFAFSRVYLNQNHNKASLIKVVFYHLLILSLLAVVTWRTNRNTLVVLVILIILWDVYNRLKTQEPTPTIKEVFADTKTAVKEMWSEIKKINGRKKDLGAGAKTNPNLIKKTKGKKKK